MKYFGIILFVSIVLGCAHNEESLLSEADFSYKINEKTISLYTLKNDNGLICQLTNFGARVVSLYTPDKDGKLGDIVIGYGTGEDFVTKNENFFGATIGRYGNRIGNGVFKIEGNEFQLEKNDGENHLHGGSEGFPRQVWEVEKQTNSEIIFSYLSPDMEGGYPGNVTLNAIAYSSFANNNNEQEFQNVWLDDLDISGMELSHHIGKAKSSFDGNAIKIAGKVYERGVGIHARSAIFINLGGNAKKFTAYVGVDDECEIDPIRPSATIRFFVIGDGKILYESQVKKLNEPAEKIEVDVSGIQEIGLLADPTEDKNIWDHGDWADAKFIMNINAELPSKIENEDSTPYILTPKPPLEPRINGARVFGLRVNSPFLFTIPATGKRPMKFEAIGLPKGLSLNGNTGQITGVISTRDTFIVQLIAINDLGKDEKALKIVVGDEICLTPPMGWSSWNCWRENINEKKILTAANEMYESGLINHGYSYINIDDGWQGKRGGKFNAIQPNQKFTNFYDLSNYIHGLGLKFGVYSTPWIITYEGLLGGSGVNPDGVTEINIDTPYGVRKKNRVIGRYKFYAQDVRQFVDWGVDYFKYDWMLDVDITSAEIMQHTLMAANRDIVYSLSNAASFDYAEDWSRVSNLWRITGDIVDNRLSIYDNGFAQGKWQACQRPGHWNDSDMFVIGHLVDGNSKLLPQVQYSHVTLWSLFSSPFILGNRLELMDEFTLNLITNDEVIAVDQDEKGNPAKRIKAEGNAQVWVKELSDGSLAVGLFNSGNYELNPATIFPWKDKKTEKITITWDEIGLSGKYNIRDIWRQKDIGNSDEEYTAEVPFGGVSYVKLSKIDK